MQFKVSALLLFIIAILARAFLDGKPAADEAHAQEGMLKSTATSDACIQKVETVSQASISAVAI